MIKLSKFDIKYTYHKHGQIERKLLKTKRMPEDFSKEYEIVKYFGKSLTS